MMVMTRIILLFCCLWFRSFAVSPESTSISISPNQTGFCLGSNVTINCTSIAKPPANYTLYHNTKLVRDNSTSGVFHLILNDEGKNNYTCVAYNLFGLGKNKSRELLVREPPTINDCKVISNRMINGAVIEGENVTLRCNMTGSEPLNVTWTNGGHVRNQRSLVFDPVSRTNDGHYHVTVQSGKECNKTQGENLSLNVYFSPESTSISVSPDQKSFCLGSNVTINCTSYAKPPANYSLYHNTKLVRGDGASGMFHITLSATQYNNYTCVPYNTVGFGQNRSLELLVKEPPTISDCKVISNRMINGAVIEEEIVTLRCNITGSEPLNVTWTNGSHVWNQRSLVFDPVSRTNDGHYHVTVNNGKECNEARGNNISLNVYFSPESTSISISPNQTGFCLGSNVTINCTSYAKPPANYFLYHNTNLIRDNSPSGMFHVTLNHAGKNIYTCVPYNTVGLGQNRSLEFLVKEITSISISPNQTGFCLGSNVTISCTSHAKLPASYSLYHNTKLLLDNSRNGIFHVTLNDAGKNIYTCVPYNTMGFCQNESLELLVKEPPKITDCQIDNSVNASQPVIEGNVVTVTCRTTGSRPLTGKWTKDGRIWNRNELVFNPIHREDAGCYRFTVSNGVECQHAQEEIPLAVHYLDDLQVIGSSNQSYSQSNPVVLFNLSVNAYPSNTTTLSCRSSTPALTAITSHDAGLYTKHYMVFVLVKSTAGTGSIVCRAKHDAGERERTLHFYNRPIPFKTTIVGQLIITNHEWQDELKDAKSAAYNDLRKKCIKIIENAYSGLTYLAGVKIKEFLKGSIKVRFELQVTGQVSDPLLPLRDYVKRQGGEIDGLKIDYNSIQKSSDVRDDPPIPVPEDSKTLASALGSLFALSIVLNLLFIASFIWLRRKGMIDSRGCFEKRSSDSDERGKTNEISLQETGLNDTPDASEYEPVERRELAASNSGIPEYEAVTPRTVGQWKVPLYENTNRHRLPGTDWNTPPRIYQNTQPQSSEYGSLNPSTRLPVKVLPPTGIQTRGGEYQAVQHKGVCPQYQSLEDLSRC